MDSAEDRQPRPVRRTHDAASQISCGFITNFSRSSFLPEQGKVEKKSLSVLPQIMAARVILPESMLKFLIKEIKRKKSGLTKELSMHRSNPFPDCSSVPYGVFSIAGS